MTAKQDQIKDGDNVIISDSNYGAMGIYDKSTLYIVFGGVIKGKTRNATGTTWQIRTDQTTVTGKPIPYGKEFFLYNVDHKKWMTDDKRSGGFDGADGYFGLSFNDAGGNEFAANQYRFVKENGETGYVVNGDTDLRIECASEKWKCRGEKLTVYPFNEANYLVWDSPDYTQPRLTISRIP